MDIVHDGLINPDLNQTLAFHAGSALYGYYDPATSWEVYLNTKQIKALGIYDEIFAHEHMHHQLMCGTAFGHALQLTAKLARKSERFQTLHQNLVRASWTSHEGAAMLSGYHVHCAKSPKARKLLEIMQSASDTDAALKAQGALELNYLANYHPNYEAPFRIFNFLRNTMIPPEGYESNTSVFANAVGQFYLNTDILSVLSDFFAGDNTLSQTHLNKESNYPDRRLVKLLHAVESDREAAFFCLRDLFTEKKQALSSYGILIRDNYWPSGHSGFDLDMSDSSRSAAVFDWINNVFLEWACQVSGLSVGAFHASEIADQFDKLLNKHATFFQKLGLPTERINVSTHPLRWEFKPSLREIE